MLSYGYVELGPARVIVGVDLGVSGWVGPRSISFLSLGFGLYVPAELITLTRRKTDPYISRVVGRRHLPGRSPISAEHKMLLCAAECLSAMQITNCSRPQVLRAPVLPSLCPLFPDFLPRCAQEALSCTLQFRPSPQIIPALASTGPLLPGRRQEVPAARDCRVPGPSGGDPPARVRGRRRAPRGPNPGAPNPARSVNAGKAARGARRAHEPRGATYKDDD